MSLNECFTGWGFHIIKRFFSSIYRIEYLIAAIVIFSFLDGLITYFTVKDGAVREGNPLLKDLVDDWKFIGLKLLGGVLCAFLLWDIYRRWPRLAMISTSFLASIMGCIVVWNVLAFMIST